MFETQQLLWQHVADMRHRAILHNAWGIFLCSKIFGEVKINSDGREYSVRDIAEDHVLQDLGKIPTLEEIINLIPKDQLKWLGGHSRKKKIFHFDENDSLEHD
jgi:hypothetical protein